jgi:YNFM family putative membrane transporter
MGQRVCDPMLPELSRTFGVSLGHAAQVLSVFAITYGIAQLFYGPLGDRLGKYRVVTWATAGCSIGCLLAVFAGNLNVLLLARFLMALGAAAIIPLSMAWVGDSVHTDRMQEMLTRTGFGTTFGLVAGQLVGGSMTDFFGWRSAFLLIALLFVVVGSLLYLDLQRQKREAVPEPEIAAHLTELAERPNFVRQAFIIFTGKWSRIVLALALIEGAAVYGPLAIWATHLHFKLGLSLAASGAVVAVFGLGGMAFMLAGRQLIRRFGQRGMVMAGGTMIALGALGFALSPHWAPAVPCSLLAGFGFFMFHNTMQANATGMAPQARGTAVSLFAAVLFMGNSLGVLSVAWLYDRIGSSAIITLGGFIVMVVGFVFAYALKVRDEALVAS